MRSIAAIRGIASMPSEITYPLAGKRVWVAGHRGMVGSAVVRRLAREGCEILVADRRAVDLTRQAETEAWMAEARPDAVVLAAAKVGGILANDTYPADFLYANLMIEANVVEAARRIGVEKLLLLGSSCIYPKFAPQPIAEDALLTGPLEPTNEWYAIAKIAGIKLVQAYRRQHGCDFIAAMPTNLYGPEDNFDLAGSHVLPALIRKAHEARLAATGIPARRRLRRRAGVPAPDLFGRGARQCRVRHGHRDRRSRAPRRRCRGLSRADRQRPEQARRDAAQADERRHPPDDGLGAAHPARGGNPGGIRVVQGERRGGGVRAGRRPSVLG
jgi:NAD(P)-dependent dehydrogenase (short-subunit alcohol dehydrogenase family)